jgi:serine/threonine protein kinase
LRNSSGKTVSSGDSISLEDFKIIKFLANGTFGSVFLAFLPQTESYYAIKCLLKENLLQKDMIQSAKLEKLIMLEVNHPFIVQMHYVFQKNYRVYFVMDYIGGGELFHHLQINRRFNEN